MKRLLFVLVLITAGCASSPSDNSGTAGNVRPPSVILSVDADYPMGLLGERITALDVEVEGVVDTSGTFQDARVVRSPDPRLDQAALDALQNWRFRPAMMNDTPVEAKYRVTVRFRSPR